MKSKGFTLIELLITLAIASIIAFIAVPTFSDLIKRTHSKSVVHNVISLINLTRQTAITSGKITTICGSEDGVRCDRSWGKSVIIFVDNNQNGVLDGDDELIQHRNMDLQGSLEWKAFQNKGYLQFRRDGFTNYHNGNLTYCPHHLDLKHAKQLIINVGGRIRMARDTDGNGIPNKSSGDDLSC